MSWLDNHIKDFVLPYLGYVPNKTNNFFLPEQKLRIRNIWKSVKKKAAGRTVVLTGRDTYVFEVLARRENFNTLYLPSCSRSTVSAFKIENPDKHVLFDNGFVGTIPKKLGINFLLISHVHKDLNIQLFPSMKQDREFALLFDRCPKYWTRGEFDLNGNVQQSLSPKDEFAKAFQVTREIYTDSTRN